MSLNDELASQDAIAQAELVRRKELKAEELTEAAIARAERLNPALNAIITPTFDSARVCATGPLPEGPFTGGPFLPKDLPASLAAGKMPSRSPISKHP